MANEQSIKIIKDGPYIVQGDVPLYEDAIVPDEKDHHLKYVRVKQYETEPKEYALCRCGKSKNPPFCDGTHRTFHFDGAEVADRRDYKDRAEMYVSIAGDLILYDDDRCAYARFCHRRDGDVWSLTEYQNNDGLKQEAIEASWHCPTGRLTHYDPKTNEAYEQEFEPSIVVLQDLPENTSGPLFVRGGIKLISEDGTEYQQQNRYALCRCGASQNKPFCDAYHDVVPFNDGSEAFSKDLKDVEHDSSFEDPRQGAADA